MSRIQLIDSLDEISDELQLPPEVLYSQNEKSWRTGKFLVAGAVLLGFACVVATVFWSPTHSTAFFLD
jgi:hypothetical protein